MTGAQSRGGSDWTVCVDFGTANSKAAAAHRDERDPRAVRPLIISDAANPFLLPGLLIVDPDEKRVLLGAAAQRVAAGLPANRETLRSFKTLLGARDLPRSIRTLLPPGIDPTRQFRQRDLLVLFLAYLLRGVARAIDKDVTLRSARTSGFTLRYTRPDWNRAAAAGHNREMAAMFKDAAAIAEDLAPNLDAGVVSIDRALAALDAAGARGADIQVEGAVFEAAAAAVACLESTGPRSAGVLVLDVGAGTTDIGAIGFSGDDAWEIGEARRTVPQAGDAIDVALLNLVLERSRLRGVDARARAWRDLLVDVRTGKEHMLTSGKAAFRVGDRVVRVSAREAMADPDVAAAFDAIEDAFLDGLQAASQAVRDAGGATLTVVAVGGGAALPAIQSMARSGRPKGVRMRIERAASIPDWAQTTAFGGAFAPIFPMLAVAIGGASAPSSLVSG